MRALVALVVAALRCVPALFRSRQQQAIVELALRQQLAIYAHKQRRPRLSPLDRAFWVALSRLWPRWKTVLVVVQPETVIRWHRHRFRHYWRSISSPGPGRPTISRETQDLIVRLPRSDRSLPPAVRLVSTRPWPTASPTRQRHGPPLRPVGGSAATGGLPRGPTPPASDPRQRRDLLGRGDSLDRGLRNRSQADSVSDSLAEWDGRAVRRHRAKRAPRSRRGAGRATPEAVASRVRRVLQPRESPLVARRCSSRASLRD